MVGTLGQALDPSCILQPIRAAHTHLTVLKVVFGKEGHKFFGGMVPIPEMEETFEHVALMQWVR